MSEALVKRKRAQKKRAGQFHHGNLAQAVLDEALRCVEKGEEISVRKIARTLRVSDPAIYRHFSNRAVLVAAVGQHGLDAMSRAIHEAGSAHSDPRDALFAVGSAYIRFAQAHPGWFRLYFSRSYMDEHGESPDEAAPSPDSMRATIMMREALAKLVDEDELDDWFRVLWGLAHGLAGLVTERAFRRVEKDEERIEAAEAALRLTLQRL